MNTRIEALSGRPDLAPTIARWKKDAFFQNSALTAEGLAELMIAPANGPEETFVLLDGAVPVATAALVHSDLDSRPDLTPRLAGVLVLPEFRGRGHAATLVRRVESFAVAASVPVLWLYTSKAAGLYLTLGWTHIGTEQDTGRAVARWR